MGSPRLIGSNQVYNPTGRDSLVSSIIRCFRSCKCNVLKISKPENLIIKIETEIDWSHDWSIL